MNQNIPQELADELQAAGLTDFFSECTDAHRNEYLKWIAEAKRPETQRDRVKKSVQMLSAKRRQEIQKARTQRRRKQASSR